MIRELFKKIKINVKKLISVIIISILEVVMLLWWNDWVFTPAVFIPAIQLILIIEKSDVWSKLSEKEKEEILLSNEEVENLIKGVEFLIKKGKTSNEIFNEIKKN